MSVLLGKKDSLRVSASSPPLHRIRAQIYFEGTSQKVVEAMAAN